MRMLALILGFALLALLAGPTPEATAESAADEAVYGAGSVLGTLLYAPLKTSFCVIGAVTGGLTLPFAGADTAGDVAAAACGGTWAITPDVLKGHEPVRFVGGNAPPLVNARRVAAGAR